MTDPSAPPTREEAMAAMRELAGLRLSDGKCLLDADVAMRLLTLASAGAAVMFASEETVERVARVFAESSVRCGIKAALADPDLHNEAAAIKSEDVEKAMAGIIEQTWRDFIPEARAVLAALSPQPET